MEECGETGDDNIFTNTYFPMAHKEQRKEFETGLITI
jgi:hypothetical protein